MPRNGVRSTYSQAPFKISMHDLGGEISTGTAFHFMWQNERFIVTNLHNLTGKNQFTGTAIGKSGRTPWWIEAHVATWLEPNIAPLGSFAIKPRRIEIYKDPSNAIEPLWLEHPMLGRQCDIIAIHYPKPSDEPEFMHNSVNQISSEQIPVRPGELAYVIGFPLGLKTGFGLPLWKSTFIASEPHYDVVVEGQKLPAFFLDGYTREGMSGSPVFARFRGMWDMTDPYQHVDIDAPDFWGRSDVAISGSEGTEFIGIYSGRIPEKVGEAAIGLCWTKSAIEAVCSTFFDR